MDKKDTIDKHGIEDSPPNGEAIDPEDNRMEMHVQQPHASLAQGAMATAFRESASHCCLECRSEVFCVRFLGVQGSTFGRAVFRPKGPLDRFKFCDRVGGVPVPAPPPPTP